VFGLGLGNFNLVSGAQHSGEANAWMGTHNTFTQISSEAGLPAVGLYAALLVVAIRSMYRIRRSGFGHRPELQLMASATFVSLLSFAFGACVAHLAYDYYLFYIVAIAVAVRCIASRSDSALNTNRRACVKALQTPLFVQ
jgi:O-antigen ligase